jgi:hypothetical protein
LHQQVIHNQNDLFTFAFRKMKIISKFSKKTKAQPSTNIAGKDIKNIDFTCNVVHVGHVLTISDINKNRSSKYNYLSF